MTPVTKDETSVKKAKQPILASKKPEVLSTRAKLPLYLMKSALKYLSREEQEALRTVCQFWKRCMSTRPSHFGQLFIVYRLSCGWYDPEDEVDEMVNEHSWPIIERSMKCCGQLKSLVSKMAGQLFIPALAANAKISFWLTMPHRRWIYYWFDNKLTKETARHALHLFAHLGESAFNNICDWKQGAFLGGMHPEIASLFCPMRCRKLTICVKDSETDIPSPESLTAAVNSQELEWYFESSSPSPAQVKNILEKFFIDAHRPYNSMKIYTCCGGNEDDQNHRWTSLFKMVIQFFSERLKESCEVVPRVNFYIGCCAPGWPLSPFSEMEPISEETEREETIKRTYEFKTGGAKTFKVEVECNRYNGGVERIIDIVFLFE